MKSVLKATNRLCFRWMQSSAIFVHNDILAYLGLKFYIHPFHADVIINKPCPTNEYQSSGTPNMNMLGDCSRIKLTPRKCCVKYVSLILFCYYRALKPISTIIQWGSAMWLSGSNGKIEEISWYFCWGQPLYHFETKWNRRCKLTFHMLKYRWNFVHVQTWT